jgi:hypothetical protein
MHLRSIVPPARLGGARLGAARLAVVVFALLGTAAGIATVGLARGEADRSSSKAPGAGIQVDATHLPPLLTLPGESIDLSFDAVCVPAGNADDVPEEDPCAVTGSAFARPGTSGPFTELPLVPAAPSRPGALQVRVPDELARSRTGFSYYAVLHADHGDGTVTIPAGGAAAPLVSMRLEHPVRVDLGRHVFGRLASPSARVASASWGDGPFDAGLEPGRREAPIGASAFDVDRTGAVYLLDETHHRVLRWVEGSPRPVRVPVSVNGTLADMTVARDGSLYVLETVADSRATPLVRRFDGDGRELEAVETADRTPEQIRRGPDGPVVLEQPSGQWMPVAVRGTPAGPQVQRHAGQTGRPVEAGGYVTVLRRGNEIRIAAVGPSGARRAWDITSASDIAEVQLAEPVGRSVVVVAHVYSDTADEFVVLLLAGRGLVRSFTVNSADWAESAPLGRFKIAGAALYRLGSTPAGVFVDRFDLEEK